MTNISPVDSAANLSYSPESVKTTGLDMVRRQFGATQLAQAVTSAYSSGMIDALSGVLQQGGAPKPLIKDLVDTLSKSISNSPALKQYMGTAAGMQSVANGAAAGREVGASILSKTDDSMRQAPATTDAAPRPQAANSTIDPNSFDMMKNSMSQETNNTQGSPQGSGGANGGVAGWLLAMAKGLAEAQISILDKMKDAQEKMTDSAGASEDDDQQRDDFIMAQTEFQAASKLFSMVSEVTATSLKAVGEGLTTVVRKM